MTPSRRRSLALGAVAGLLLAAVVAFVLSRQGEGGAVLRNPGGSSAGAGIPLAPDLDGKQLPDVQLQRFDGTSVDLRSYAGRPMVLNVWSSTCAPCVKEMPAIEATHQRLGDKVAFVGIDNQDAPEAADALAAKTGVTYDLLRDPQGDLFVRLGLAVMPTTILVDANGRIVKTHAGALADGELDDLVAHELSP
jgi:cytochrome c biogenesis protein CcmG, thiol:disulfide interchange protein DsbE